MTTVVPSRPSEAVFAAVCYSDALDVPIMFDDLHRFVVGTALTELETSMAVDDLVNAGRLDRRGDLIFLAGREDLAAADADQMGRAEKMWEIAEEVGRAIGALPLVRMVAVTGNLALNHVSEADTIELFVAVRPRRLWIARWLTMRVARRRAWKHQRVNVTYLATLRSLALPTHTMFLARELAQMSPIVGGDITRTLRRSNPWIFDFLPNATIEGDMSHLSDIVPTSRQKWTEWFLLLPPFRPVENWLRRRGMRRVARRVAMATPGPLFSEEICAPTVVARSAELERRWHDRITPPE